MLEAAALPADLVFFQEWQRIVIAPNGERWDRLDSGWYADEAIARSLLNAEYPEPSGTGFRYMLQTRWTSEHRPVDALEDIES